MLDFKFSWQVDETKGFNPDQPRRADGRWGSGPARTLIGEAFLDAQKAGGSHKITVHNSRVKKYAGHDTVESFVANHKRGRAAALRELAADHAAGKISLSEPVTGQTPAAAKPKPADKPAEKPAEKPQPQTTLAVSRKVRFNRPKEGASFAPIPRDANRSGIDTLVAAHQKIAEPDDAARLSHLRQVLGNYSRAEQDRMLHSALHSPRVALGQISDNRDVDSIENAAAFSPGGEPFHLLRVSHGGRKSVGPGIDEIDGTDTSEVTDQDLRDLFTSELLTSAGLG